MKNKKLLEERYLKAYGKTWKDKYHIREMFEMELNVMNNGSKSQ